MHAPSIGMPADEDTLPSSLTSDKFGPYRSRLKGVAGRREPGWLRWVVWPCGVVMPLGVLVFELVAGWCKDALFDPLPGLAHVLLVALVPIANLFALVRRVARFSRLQLFLNGAALLVTLVYSLIFTPLVPLSFIALFYFGLGLLSLSPFFALAATLAARRLITARSSLEPMPRLGLGLVGALAAFLSLAGAALPQLLTQHGLRMATSGDPRIAQEGRQFLHRYSTNDALLRACTRDIGRHTSSPLMLGFLFGAPVAPESAAEVFYRVTGRVCTTRAEDFDPGLFERGRRWSTFAEDPGGADAARDLKLVSSRLDGSVDAVGAVGYLEWTMVIHNASSWPQEATAELELPANAVVSRATLWIDGEPREAAFASRAQARQAYERVVSRRKDPLLVTSIGRGKVELRCFPVPSRGEMKIRVGVTVPLLIEDQSRALLVLPSMTRRSFALGAPHQVWIEAKQPFQLGDAKAGAISGGFGLEQSLPAAALRPGETVLAFERNPALAESWSADPTDAEHIVTQRVETYRPAALDRLSIVVDGSAGQEPAVGALRRALTDFASGAELSVSLAADGGVIELFSRRRADRAPLAELERTLSKVDFAGGADDVPALAAELEHAGKSGVVLWLHGPQPYLFEHPERIRQLLERSGPGLQLFELQTAPGRNRVVEELEGAPGFVPIERAGGLEASLRRQLRIWAGAPGYRALRNRVPRASTSEKLAPNQTSDHLARLWAYEEIERLAGAKQRDSALKLASAHKLVTSVSGAVVLETAQQYAEAGLTPGSVDNLPSVPEPAFWALLGAALVLLLVAVWFSRRFQARVPACG